MSADAHLLAVTAGLLRQGRALHLTAVGTTVATVATTSGPAGGLVAAAALLAVAVETWAALRVGLDAELFGRLADDARDGRLDWLAFDDGLVRAGLIPTPTGRPAEARVAGAMRWLRIQGALVALLVGLALLGLLTG